MKACLTCGAAFEPTGRAHRYCSYECRPCAQPGRSGGPPAPRGTCPTCGVEYDRTRRGQRYCSVGCRASSARAYPWAGPRPSYLAGPAGRAMLARRDVVVRLRAAGLTLKAIGEQLGVTRQRVHQLLNLSVPEPADPAPAPPPGRAGRVGRKRT